MPPLYSEFTPEEAVKACDPSCTVDWYCDRQFAVLPHVVLCFFICGIEPAGSKVFFPSSVTWWPADREGGLGVAESLPIPDETPDSPDRFPWFPRPVRGEFGEPREHHIFLRSLSDNRYTYAGPAHLGSIGDGRGGREAGFSLEAKLPRDLWLNLGGFNGWRVDINHRTQEIEANHVGALEVLLSEMPTQEFSHLTLTRYEEDSLSLYTNANRGWLMYLREPADSGFYTRDVTYDADPARDEFFQCDCGIDLEFKAALTLPRDRAIDVVREFFRLGRLPDSVPWADERAG